MRQRHQHGACMKCGRRTVHARANGPHACATPSPHVDQAVHEKTSPRCRPNFASPRHTRFLRIFTQVHTSHKEKYCKKDSTIFIVGEPERQGCRRTSYRHLRGSNKKGDPKAKTVGCTYSTEMRCSSRIRRKGAEGVNNEESWVRRE